MKPSDAGQPEPRLPPPPPQPPPPAQEPVHAPSGAAAVFRIAVPTSFAMGATNAYLIPGPEPVLVDPGVRTPEALRALEAGLAAYGTSIKAMRGVIVTHGHLDHFGLARAVRNRSGARVYAHRYDARVCEGFPDSVRKANVRYREFSLRLGFPPELYGRMETAYARTFEMAEGVPVDVELSDGDLVPAGGREWRVLHTPGHTPGSICLLNEELGLLLSGDTVLRDITPNPFFGGHSHNSSMGLGAYLQSLGRLEGLGQVKTLPGHGPVVEDLPGVLASTRRHHAEREGRILALLRAEGPLDAFQVSGRIFAELPVSQVWLAFAEVVGHLEVMEAAGTVVRTGGGGQGGEAGAASGAGTAGGTSPGEAVRFAAAG
ncbi:MAG: MBL fold metallo-hydrolase [Planctomycetes bacterium]|nr:MBL fold metallo-hydrolase [Planctomycetota bacterium]